MTFYFRQRLALVRKNLRLLSQLKFAYILTPCPACAQEIGEHWPLTPGLEREERKLAESVAAKTLDPIALIQAAKGTKAFATAWQPQDALFHLSCLSAPSTAANLEKILPESRHLRAENGVNCCGASLIYGNKNERLKAMSEQLGRNLRDRILATGARTLLTNCPACKARLKRIMARNNDPVQVRHVVELFAGLPDRDRQA